MGTEGGQESSKSSQSDLKQRSFQSGFGRGPEEEGIPRRELEGGRGEGRNYQRQATPARAPAGLSGEQRVDRGEKCSALARTGKPVTSLSPGAA